MSRIRQAFDVARSNGIDVAIQLFNKDPKGMMLTGRHSTIIVGNKAHLKFIVREVIMSNFSRWK